MSHDTLILPPVLISYAYPIVLINHTPPLYTAVPPLIGEDVRHQHRKF